MLYGSIPEPGRVLSAPLTRTRSRSCRCSTATRPTRWWLHVRGRERARAPAVPGRRCGSLTHGRERLLRQARRGLRAGAGPVHRRTASPTGWTCGGRPRSSLGDQQRARCRVAARAGRRARPALSVRCPNPRAKRAAKAGKRAGNPARRSKASGQRPAAADAGTRRRRSCCVAAWRPPAQQAPRAVQAAWWRRATACSAPAYRLGRRARAHRWTRCSRDMTAPRPSHTCLHAGGALRPECAEDSTELERLTGEPGPGRYVSVYANAGHAFVYVGGLRFDTVGRTRAGDTGPNCGEARPEVARLRRRSRGWATWAVQTPALGHDAVVPLSKALRPRSRSWWRSRSRRAAATPTRRALTAGDGLDELAAERRASRRRRRRRPPAALGGTAWGCRRRTGGGAGGVQRGSYVGTGRTGRSPADQRQARGDVGSGRRAA